MKVVKQISTGKIVHREIPEFKDGMGIVNASILNKIDKSDLEEVEVTEKEWDDRHVVFKGKVIKSEAEAREINKEDWMNADNMELLMTTVYSMANGLPVPPEFNIVVAGLIQETKETADFLIANNLKKKKGV